MKTVFADAFYFVGLINRTDQHHRKVVAAARQLREAILTTEWILAEFVDALSLRRSALADFRRRCVFLFRLHFGTRRKLTDALGKSRGLRRKASGLE